MIAMQQTDIQNGEIIRIGYTSMGHYADVALKNGKVAELVRVQLEVKEYRQIHGASVENQPVCQNLQSSIIKRAYASFQA